MIKYNKTYTQKLHVQIRNIQKRFGVIRSPSSVIKIYFFPIQTKVKFVRYGRERRLKGLVFFYKYVNYTKQNGVADVIPSLVARISDGGIVETEEMVEKWGLLFP